MCDINATVPSIAVILIVFSLCGGVAPAMWCELNMVRPVCVCVWGGGGGGGGGVGGGGAGVHTCVI